MTLSICLEIFKTLWYYSHNSFAICIINIYETLPEDKLGARTKKGKEDKFLALQDLQTSKRSQTYLQTSYRSHI